MKGTNTNKTHMLTRNEMNTPAFQEAWDKPDIKYMRRAMGRGDVILVVYSFTSGGMTVLGREEARKLAVHILSTKE